MRTASSRPVRSRARSSEARYSGSAGGPGGGSSQLRKLPGSTSSPTSWWAVSAVGAVSALGVVRAVGVVSALGVVGVLGVVRAVFSFAAMSTPSSTPSEIVPARRDPSLYAAVAGSGERPQSGANGLRR